MNFLILLFSISAMPADQMPMIVEDLRDRWQVKEGDAWVTYNSGKANTDAVYFSIDASANYNHRLVVAVHDKFSLWCNGKLIAQKDRGEISLRIDSLARFFSSKLRFGLFSKRGIEFASANLISHSPAASSGGIELRTSRYFHNFAILVALLIGFYFIVLFRTNPRLTLDYFNFIKLFSFQERDENLVAGRVTSSFNLLVYLFIGLWFSFLFAVIFHYTPDHRIISNVFSFHSVSGGFLTWLKLSAIILAALFLKLTIVMFISNLFRLREGYAIQVLNFFRLLIFILMLLSVLIVIYFIFGAFDSEYYNTLIHIIGWMLAGWTLLIFFKLLNKAQFSGFHLFSYLCATEIFPLVILFEALFF